MKEFLVVAVTDRVSRNFTRFLTSAMLTAIESSFEFGTPSFVSHDFHRLIGWNRPTAVYVAPDMSRLVGSWFMAETEEEEAAIRQNLLTFLQRRIDEHQDDFDELRVHLERHDPVDAVAVVAECVALQGQDLAKEVAPEVFAAADDDGLVPLSELEPIGPGVYRYGALALFAHQFFRRSMSRLNTTSYQFLEYLQQLNQARMEVLVALDNDMVGLAETYRPRLEAAYWFGPEFSEDVSSIPTGITRHQAGERLRLFTGIDHTEFWWQSRQGLHILEAEEVYSSPTPSEPIETYRCRYVHSIVDESEGAIQHFDGAIRSYGLEQMLERVEVNLSGAARNTDYTKLWRIDGQVETSEWKTLLLHFYRDNYLVGEYLGLGDAFEQEEIVEELSQEPSLVESRVPHSMNVGDGVRVALSWHQPSDLHGCERAIVPLHSIRRQNGESAPSVEDHALELQKVLRRRGHPVHFEDSIVPVAFKDGYFTLPLVAHAREDLEQSLTQTYIAIADLIKAWNDAERDFVGTFAVAIPVAGRELWVSAIGHISDLESWLATPQSIPPTGYSDLLSWSNDLAEAISAGAPDAENSPPIADVLASSGELDIKRVAIDEDRIHLLFDEERQALVCELRVTAGDEESVEDLRESPLTAAMAMIVHVSKCSKCQQPYVECDHSKTLDDNVFQVVEDAEPVGFFWTDRPVVRLSEDSDDDKGDGRQ